MSLLRALVALLLMPAGLVVSGAGSPAAAADPMAGAPAVGSCFDVPWRPAFKPVLRAAPVDCAGRHTLRVVAVRQLPSRLSGDEPQKKLNRVAGSICMNEVSDTVGGTLRTQLLSLHTTFYFLPSKAERAAGARWINCSVGLLDSRGMVDLPAGELPGATRRPADSVAACMTGRYRLVVCTSPHEWRARKGFVARANGEAKERYTVGRDLAERRCARLIGSKHYAWYVWLVDGRRIGVACFEWDQTRPLG